MAFEITDSNFQEEILNSDKVSLVDFSATWCGPCKTLSPIIDELHEEFKGKAIVGKLDVDNNQETAGKYGVRSVPTILIIKNGEVVDKHVGVASKEELEKKINAHL
ncbi:thioredoxin [Ichthyobacterium seriolicida]|uniref:Thioredoxin n=1 Tax=Ichthyobacterium seriolicida TaxID=242600 RepID=A0A1J1DXJ9_9FLAO|nr:thioredoxin [Ichthyobacterium seriolicida]BAV94586.1 thioredoxin [Ichthyobacterium seriolicida]